MIIFWMHQNITHYQMLIHFSLEENCLLKEKEMGFFSPQNLQESQQLCESLLISFETKEDMSALSIPFTYSLIYPEELSAIGLQS